MIENVTIITGTPGEVAAKLQEFLDSHPKAEVLSSAVTVNHTLSEALVESVKPSGKKGKEAKAKEETKAKEADDSTEASETGEAPAEEAAQESGTVTTVCVIAGIRH